MADAVIVDAVRSAGGRRNGGLSSWHPVDLAAEVLTALVDRNNVDPAAVEDVIMGCVMQAGAQSVNVGRNAVLAAGWPDSVPATTIDRQCGSSQQAFHFAAQAVMAGVQDVVIGAGVEVMSAVPMGASIGQGYGQPFGDRVNRRYEERGGLVPQGIAAELIAERWGLSRDELDTYALRSHRRAALARDRARFDREIVPVGSTTVDEGIRDDTTLAALAELRPTFREDGIVTAGNSSQICDGASAALIMSETRAEKLGLTPRARIVALSVVGVDPVTMLTGPIPATSTVLDRAGLSLDEIDRIEINEAFASVVLAWEREHRPDMERVNVNGGAIALGHPLGASGTKLLATLVSELERCGGRYGLQTMCEGGGMANAAIVERLG